MASSVRKPYSRSFIDQVYSVKVAGSGIRSGIPVHLKNLNVEESKITSLKFQCAEKIFDPVG